MLATVTTDILATLAAGPRQTGWTVGQGLFARILADVATTASPADPAGAGVPKPGGLSQNPFRRRAELEDLGIALDGLVEWAVSLPPGSSPVALNETPSSAGAVPNPAHFDSAPNYPLTGGLEPFGDIAPTGRGYAPDLQSSTILSGWQVAAMTPQAGHGAAAAGSEASTVAPQFSGAVPNTSAPQPEIGLSAGNGKELPGPALMSGATGQPVTQTSGSKPSAVLPASEPTVVNVAVEDPHRTSTLSLLGDRLGTILQRFDADHGTDTVGVLADNLKALQALDLPPDNPVSAAARLAALARGLFGVPDAQIPAPLSGFGATSPGNDARFAGSLFGADRPGAHEPFLPMPAPMVEKRPNPAVAVTRSAAFATGGVSLADLAPQIRPIDVSTGIRRVQFAPPELGEATFEVAQVAQGRVSVLVRAEDPRVLAVLRENAAAIAGFLRDGVSPASNSATGRLTVEVSVAPRPGLAEMAAPPAEGRPPVAPAILRHGAETSLVPAGDNGSIQQTLPQRQTVRPDVPVEPGGDGRRAGGPILAQHDQPAAPNGKPAGLVPGHATTPSPGERRIEPVPATTLQSSVPAMPDIRATSAMPELLPVRSPETAYPSQSHTQQAALAANLSEQIRSNRILIGTTRIELAPKGLGTLEIDLAHDEAGGLKITVRAESMAVLGALRENRDVLLSVLRDSGVTVQNGSLGFEDFGRGARQQYKPEAGEYKPAAKAEPDSASAVVPLTETVLPRGRIDIIT